MVILHQLQDHGYKIINLPSIGGGARFTKALSPLHEIQNSPSTVSSKLLRNALTSSENKEWKPIGKENAIVMSHAVDPFDQRVLKYDT